MTDFLQTHPDGVVLAVDQMSLYFQATMTRVWAPRGQTPTLRVATQREWAHFYGALNVITGHEIAETMSGQNGELTVQFVQHLQNCYPGRALLILWDRAQWHRGAIVRRFLEQQPLIETLHFPPGSPQFNPQEHVWGRTRAAVSHNHTHQDFAGLVQAFEQHLTQTRFQFDWIERFAPPILYEV